MSGAIANLLDLMRVNSTAYIAKNLKAPWGVFVDDYKSLARFHFVVSGTTWIGMSDSDDAIRLNKGDIAIVMRGKAHSYFDDQTTETVARNYPNGPDGARFELFDKNSEDTHLLCGYFEVSDSTPQALLSSLPDLVIGKHDEINQGRKLDLVVNLATEELSKPSSGSVVTLNRLTELLCVHTFQDWFERNLDDNPALQALSDPKIKGVLDEIHSVPDAPWTIDSLAQLYGKSRSAFVTHFKIATGHSPMSYVRQWRINLACSLLRSSTMSIDEVAFKSGYSDTNAFNRAFKRETGTSPGAYKRDKMI